MVPMTTLWLPILLSGVIVFVASAIIHMVLPFHRGDFKGVPKEDEVRAALRSIPPGDYHLPHAGGPNAMKDPGFVAKYQEGPVVIMTVVPPGPLTMAPQLGQWFAFCLLVSALSAYVAGRALGHGAGYPAVFRFAGTSAFLSYTMALWQNSIWYRRSWAVTMRSSLDGLLYGMLTGGTFGWLWPK